MVVTWALKVGLEDWAHLLESLSIQGKHRDDEYSTKLFSAHFNCNYKMELIWSTRYCIT